MPDQIYSVTWNGKEKVSYVYDGLGRLTTKNIGSFVPVIAMRMLAKIKQPRLLNQLQPLQKHIHTLMIISAIRLDSYVVQYNLCNYCFNNPIILSDDTGDLPEWAINLTKVAIGVVAIGIGVAATVATGGAAVPVLVASVKIAVPSADVSAAVGAGIVAVEHQITTGSGN